MRGWPAPRLAGYPGALPTNGRRLAGFNVCTIITRPPKECQTGSSALIPHLCPGLPTGLPTRLLCQNSFFLASGAHLSVQGSESPWPRNAHDHWACQNEVKDLGQPG